VRSPAVSDLSMPFLKSMYLSRLKTVDFCHKIENWSNQTYPKIIVVLFPWNRNIFLSNMFHKLPQLQPRLAKLSCELTKLAAAWMAIKAISRAKTVWARRSVDPGDL
jgi:hypothetical protein